MKDYGALQNGSDIRGVAMTGEPRTSVNLTPEATVDLTRAFAMWLSDHCGKRVEELVVACGRDSRESGPDLLKTICDALAECGATVLDCGMASTPAMFMATSFPDIDADGAIMVTASHLPPQRNGFKYFSKDGGLDKEDISEMIRLAESDLVIASFVQEGRIEPCDLMQQYAGHLRLTIVKGLDAAEDGKPLKGLHIVVDAGNGAGGFFATDVLAPLGADISGSQFLEPDGMFPNHSPNPEDAKAMESVAEAVKKAGADLGLLFDADVDRSGAVCDQGLPIAGNGIVALAASLVQPKKPGQIIVTDSVTSDTLTTFLEEELKFEHFRYKRGYRNVISKAIELNEAGKDCPLAVETSGHAAYRDNHFLDDGAHLAALIIVSLANLKKEGKGIRSLIAGLVEPVESAEFRIPIRAEGSSRYADGVLMELEYLIRSGTCTEEKPCEGRCRCGMTLVEPSYEGVRVSCDKDHGDGWFLLRKSLHEPLLPLNIESNQPGGVNIIAEKVLELLSVYTSLNVSAIRKMLKEKA